MNTDTIANIPLIFTAVLAVFIIALLVVTKIRKTAKVSFISFFALIVLIVACVRALFNSGMLAFNLMILLATVLLIPYCVMLAFGKPKEESKRPEEEESAPAEQNIQQTVVQEIKPEEVSLLDKGREFISIAANTFLEVKESGDSAKGGEQALLDSINKACMEVTGADGGAVLLVDEFDDVISVKSFMGDFPPPYKLPEDLPHKQIRVSTSFKYAQFPLRDNIFGEIASSGAAELITVPKIDDRIYENGPEDFLKLGSFMFVPLKIREKDVVIGLIALSRAPSKDTFTESEFNYAQTLGDFAESALKTTLNFKQYREQQELTRESGIATDLQVSLLPKKLPPIQGVSFGCFMEQTAGVCSDAYDVVPARQDRTSFVLMDVAGKGMTSLLVITMIRAMLRLIVNTTQSAGTILSWANRGICAENTLDHFASVALLNYDATKRKVQLATSGTIPVLRYNATKGAVESVSVSCEPIGVEKSKTYKDIEFIAGKGDILITYTDGLAEALNSSGKQYNVSNMYNIIKENCKLSGKEIANLIKSDMKKFVGTESLHDDQTLLVIKIQ
ncbi:MAG: SpoIIE family protein phosphatase [Treponema sp.]|nr:SpoIIE family protein phosphatase [Treponema sp.]